MKTCEVSSILAYIAAVYIITCIIYLYTTRKYGTPFKDAVKKYPELMEIKRKSVEERSNAFYTGLIISTIVMILTKPFGDCY
jgi:hypothetical protein